MAPLGYTTRNNVENLLGKTYPEIADPEFNIYLGAAETYINNYLGYNAQTTTSGILSESVVREKQYGKVDQFGNLVIDVMHPPIHFDVNNNPLVSLLTFNVGSVEVTLNLTDGTQNAKNTVLEVAENRRKIYYPSIYFIPAISTVTPSAKVNLFNLKDVRFWTDISYIGGYDTVPGDIQMATTFIAADYVTHRNNPQNLVSVSQGSFSQTFAQKSSNTKGFRVSDNYNIAHQLLQPYVRVVW